MGNILAKYRKAKWVDGGAVREPPSSQDDAETGESGHYTRDAWGVQTRPAKDYDASLVKKLIRQRRLAPYYEGVTDLPDSDSGSDETESSGASLESGENARGRKERERREKKRLRKSKKKDLAALEASFFDESWMAAGLVECPICLLAFPRNINYTECCHQPLCTSCFVKLRRPPSGRVIACPFCVHANLSVVYHKPRWMAELLKDEDARDKTQCPESVVAESLKLMTPLTERLTQHQPRYYYVRNGQSNGSGNGSDAPRRYVFYEPSGAYTFYDNMYYRTPAYYQHYQQQQYQMRQHQQADSTAATLPPDSYEQAQMNEAIRQSLLDSSRAAQEYSRMHT